MNLKEFLEQKYIEFDFSQIHPDPIEFPHRFTDDRDIEISSFISSVFSFGNIKQIMKFLENLHKIMGNSPYDFVCNFKRKYIKADVYYRFYSSDTIIQFLEIIKSLLSEYQSIQNYLNSGSLKITKVYDILELISLIPQQFNLEEGRSKYISRIFPKPSKGSACKRMNMFLRWMLRKDSIDFGLWNIIDKSELIIPLDANIFEISKKLSLTKRSSISWKTAEEITNSLKEFDYSDPVKYDFSLCHINMRKINYIL